LPDGTQAEPEFQGAKGDDIAVAAGPPAAPRHRLTLTNASGSASSTKPCGCQGDLEWRGQTPGSSNVTSKTLGPPDADWKMIAAKPRPGSVSRKNLKVNHR